MTTTAIDLLDCLRAHLAAFELPDLCSVHASIHEPHITAQLRTQDPPQLAAACWPGPTPSPSPPPQRGGSPTATPYTSRSPADCRTGCQSTSTAECR